MTVPKRLIDEGTAFDRALLSAGRDERPSGDYERRVIAAASALPASASASAGRPSLLSRLVRPQYLAVVVAIGAGTAFLSSTSVPRGGRSDAASAATAEREVDPAPRPTTSFEANEGALLAVAVVATPDALPSAPAAAAPRASAPAAPPSAPVAASAREIAPAVASGASLQREVELLDTVKRSLRSGAHADAERSLESYDAEFPSGTLKPEAGFLRIRLLLAKGDRAKARALGDELRTRYPNGVHARRIQAALAADAGNEGQDQASPR